MARSCSCCWSCSCSFSWSVEPCNGVIVAVIAAVAVPTVVAVVALVGSSKWDWVVFGSIR